MKLARLLVIGFLALTTALQAQDIHFSQFYMAPLNLNPAMTGVMNCNIRISGSYRNQWASVLKSNAYNTYSLSYDQRIPVGRYDYFGVGVNFWGDQAGSLGFGTLQGKLSASYAKRMGGYRQKSHYLVAGAEAAIAQRRLDLTNAQWGEQHDGEGGFDPTRPDFEDNLNRNSFIFADISAGLLWFSVFDKNNNLYVGAAYHHLNRANMTFYDGTSEPLYSKFTIHAGGEFMMSDRAGMVPGLLWRMQGPSYEIIPGTSIKFLMGNSRRNYQAFQLGAWVRLSNNFTKSMTADAAILSTRFDYNEFTFGFSYDINVSTLRPASNANGAFEFALQYKICGPERRGVYCPNF